MKKLFLFLFVMGIVTTSCFSQFSSQILTDENELSFSSIHSFDRLKIEGCPSLNNVGAPELPMKIMKYVLPLEAQITGIEITDFDKKDVPGDYYIYPAQPPELPNGEPPSDFVDPDPVIYSSSNPYPENILISYSNGYIRGYNIITVTFCPFEYIPTQKKLSLYKSISFTINYTLGQMPFQLPLCISPARKDAVKKFIADIVDNDADIETVSGGVNNIPTDLPGSGVLSFDQFPYNIGVIPDYLIVTVDNLKNEFSRLAEWKTQKGIPTLIVTLEQDILGKYPGNDTAEQVREFLKVITNSFGYHIYILLGGDVNSIPCRLINQQGEIKPSDFYFATVLGNWNSNGDQYYGTPQDNDICEPENFVGRVPVRSSEQVKQYIDKILEYEKLIEYDDGQPTSTQIATGFLKKLSVMTGSWLEGNMTWKNTIEGLIQNPLNVPSYINKYRLYDPYNNDPDPGDAPLNKANSINCMNSESPGYNIVFHFDHSGPYTMGTSAQHLKQMLTIPDINGLTNAPIQHIMMSYGCRCNKFNLNSISKHFLTNSNGGSIVFMGPNCEYINSFNPIGSFCKHSYFDFDLSRNHAGYAYQQSQIEQWETQILSFDYLGDPEVPVWGDEPYEDLTITTTPSTLVTGSQSFTINIGRLPDQNNSGVNEVRVCVYKDNEVYLVRDIQTVVGSNIINDLVVKPETSGILYVTVTAKNYRPIDKEVTVNPNPNANLYISSVNLLDNTTGNGNGQAESGETYDLQIELTNSGGQASNQIVGAYLEMLANDLFTTIPNNSINFQSIQPGQTGLSTSNFRLSTNSSCNPDNYRFKLRLMKPSTPDPIPLDTFLISIHRPTLLPYFVRVITYPDGDNVIEPNENIVVYVTLEDQGTGLSTNVHGTLYNWNNYTYISINSSNANYNEITPYEKKENPTNSLIFHVASGWQGFTTQPIILRLNVTSDNFSPSEQYDIDFKPPQQITGLAFSSTENKIKLWWDVPTPHVRGYNVYRCIAIDGTYGKINADIIEDLTLYEDFPLEPLSIFYYKVSAISFSGVEGPLSQPLKAWTTLPYHQGFPVTDIDPLYGSRALGSPMTSDVDNDSEKEIFISFTAENGKGQIIGLNSDGTEYITNNDGNPTFTNGFYRFENESTSATPAIDDINDDGKKELITSTRWEDGNEWNGRMYAFSTVDLVPNSLVPEQIWTINPETGKNRRGVF